MYSIYRLLASFSFIFCLGIVTLPAQDWAWIKHWGSEGNESATTLITAPDGTMWLSGTYDGTGLDLSGTALEAYGQEDVYLARLSADGEVAWAVGAGSKFADETAGLAPAPGEGVFWAGIYWDSIHLADVTLTDPDGGKSIFLFRLSEGGEVGLAMSISGSSSLSLGNIAADEVGAVYLCGAFAGNLTIADTTLFAEGDRDLFVAKLDPAGELSWVARFGEEGTVSPKDIALGPMSTVYVGGHFLGTLPIGADLLEAETQDEDGFLLQLDASGQALWARKAGAQYDDLINAIAVNESGEATVVGTFLGVLAFSDELVIQTAGFNDNFFLARYSADGEPLWARSLGGQDNEQGLALELRGNEPVVAGLFRNQLELDGLSISGAPDVFNGFAAGFSEAGEARWLLPIKSPVLVVPTQLTIGSDASVTLTGSFRDELTFDEVNIFGDGLFDLFLARVAQQVTPVGAVEVTPWQVFPNPTAGPISWSLAGRARIFDLYGRVLWSAENTSSADLSAFPDGLYFLEWEDESGLERRVVAIVKVAR